MTVAPSATSSVNVRHRDSHGRESVPSDTLTVPESPLRLPVRTSVPAPVFSKPLAPKTSDEISTVSPAATSTTVCVPFPKNTPRFGPIEPEAANASLTPLATESPCSVFAVVSPGKDFAVANARTGFAPDPVAPA